MAKIRLAVFDVDGTLTKVESCWRFVHERLGTWKGGGERNAELYFEGKLSYSEWAKRDVLLWKEVPVERIKQIIWEIPYVDGVKEVFDFLRKKGVKIVLLSAGLSLLAEKIAGEIGCDCYVANELEILDGKVTGNVRVHVSLSNKGEVLRELLRRFRVKPDECLAVGDDKTMVPVFQEVAISIAFNPRSSDVERYAKITVKGETLREILPWIISNL
jgi:phosphoserine phosphatase